MDGAKKFFNEWLKEYLMLLRMFFLTDLDKRRGVAEDEVMGGGGGTEC